ncbi:MAG: phosphatidyl inositol kinase [Sclerophora amabilis]|nr:MAG: phosphatidyl inositol kinase [Sclerophora amabilis]
MPKIRPALSGYARIAQEDEGADRGYQDESDVEDPHDGPVTLSSSSRRYEPIQSQPHPSMSNSDQVPTAEPRRPGTGRRRMRRRSSNVDIKAINARLERWAEEIASKFKIGKVKGKTEEEEQLEIHHSVFQPPEGVRPATADTMNSDALDGPEERMTKMTFDDVIEEVRRAIEAGIHPKMISQGSSGSYFARNEDGVVVGVFKPKDEEPYASRNPKWTKWLHRNLFPCCFGRACLIPNLSYVSEAAAYVLDSRLRTNLVPYTDIVYLSSKSFHYDYWDRRNFYRRRKPLPPKIGSFQVFLKGFRDANIFLREHPWPDPHTTTLRGVPPPKRKKKAWSETCRPNGYQSDDDEEAESEAESPSGGDETQPIKFLWTDALQQSFREELEKLVILDYIMRNTDRGLDNWMIKVDWHQEKASIVAEAPKMNGHASESYPPRPVSERLDSSDFSGTPPTNPYRLQEPMKAVSRSTTPVHGVHGPSISVGAIDNSLSWPWKHPDAWRSFPFGWLFLPVSLIGQPFSQKTRDHFLPLLTSTKWWTQTQISLRHVFSQDSDFKEKMFARQIAVMKGQAWNVVETLKTPDHGPLELTRRARVCVWDDLVDIPVAVPLRVPSTEMRRRRDEELHDTINEEMDISAANASAPLPHHDLLGLNSPSTEFPNPNRFSLSRSNSNTNMRQSQEGGEDVQSSSSPATVDGISFERGREAENFKDAGLHASTKTRPNPRASKVRSSLDVPSRRSRGNSGSWRRHYSFSARGGSAALLYDGDDLEGDLGYAAAEGMEKNQRKVIVERLETVKSKNPVFTWC